MQNLDKIGFLKILATVEEQECIEGRRIKYVNFDFDNRTKTFWKVEFRCWGLRYIFTTTNTPETNKYTNLYEEITDWLKGEYEKSPVT